MKKVMQIPIEYNGVMCVGEAPGREEIASIRYDNKLKDYKGNPFIGPEGRYLRSTAEKVGFNISQCYITNTVHVQPRKNQYFNLSKGDIDEGREELIADIHKWKPNLIIALGGNSLNMLTGKNAITKYRGAAMKCELVDGYKVLATVHPGFIFRGNPQYAAVLNVDLKKANREKEFKHIHFPERNIEVIRDAWDACQLLEKLSQSKVIQAVDIETGGPQLLAYGIATSRDKAYVIDKHLCKNSEVLKAISRYAESDAPKMYHNALYDVFYMAYYYNMIHRNTAYDTMLAQHAIYPTLPKSLGFCGSFYTNEPYWKCLKGDVEVLTPSGWKQLQNLQQEEVAMTSDESGFMCFDAVQKIELDFDGIGKRIKTLRHDCWYSPDHRLLTKTVHGSVRVKYAKDLKGRFNIVSAGSWDSEASGGINQLRLMAAIQADASVRWDRNKQVYFRLKKVRKIERLKEICEKLSVNIIEHNSGDGYFSCEIKGYFVSEAVMTLGPNKDFSYLLLNYSKETLKEFLLELTHWDGWITFNGDALNYSSTNLHNIDVVQAIAHCCGYTTHVMNAAGEKWDNCKKISMKKTDCVTVKPKQITDEYFKGKVYCLKTLPGFFLCRSNGHVFITGNSEGKEMFEGLKHNKIIDWERFYIYNGKDCCLTYEVYEEQQEEIKEWGVQEAVDLMHRCIEPALFSQMKGLRVSDESIEDFKINNTKAIENLEKIAKHALGDVNVKSPKQLKELIYGQWKLPEQRLKGKVTTGSIALRKLEKFPTPFMPHIGLIMSMKKHYKLKDFYTIVRNDDGRVRFSHKLHGTITGRWASSKSITGSGFNLQNQPKSVRHFYVADEGKILFQPDLSNAEARFVAAICGDIEWLKGFDIEDQHSKLATQLFDIPVERVRDKYIAGKTYRDYAKKNAHATHYLEGIMGTAMTLGCPVNVAKALRVKYFDLRPKIKDWHAWVNSEVRKKRYIRTAFGRVIQFFGPNFSDLLPSAVATEPQSTSVDYLTHGMLNCFDNIPEFEFLQQGHDSYLAQLPNDIKFLRKILPLVQELMTFEVTVHGTPLRVPIDFSLGLKWGNMVDFKHVDELDKVYDKINAGTK